MGQARLGGFLLFVCSTLFSNGSILTRKVTERFFVEFFGFLFDNTSQTGFVCISLSQSLSFLYIVEYGLGQCYRFITLTYSCSALGLSQSKSNLVVFFIWGFEQALVFQHKFEPSILSGIFLKIICMGFCGLALWDKYCADSKNTHLVPMPTMKGTLIILPYFVTPSLISSNITNCEEKTLRIL